MRKHMLRNRWLALALAAVVAPAFAADGDNDAYRQAKATAKTQYDTANKQCGSMSGNAKDICQHEAKLVRAKAEADAEMAHKGSKPKAQQDAREKVAKAEYELAKERCDDKGGNEKDVCQKAAKADYDKAKADAKAQMKTSEARADAAETKRDADKKVAKERCEDLAGDAKKACEARAKTALGK